ncbi:MAG: hypothetical protein ACXVPN_11885 [Bacteroidia bacterium]
MKTKNLIPANTAIKEAIKLGFRTRFIHHKGRIRSAITGKNYSENEFAVVRSYAVNIAGDDGMMEYIVLNSGKLGFILDKPKTETEHDEILQLEPISQESF